MWEDDHEHDERYQEHRHQNNGDAIEVLLNDARSLVRTIHARSDHVRNAGTFTRMQQYENDESDARKNEQDGKDDCEY